MPNQYHIRPMASLTALSLHAVSPTALWCLTLTSPKRTSLRRSCTQYDLAHFELSHRRACPCTEHHRTHSSQATSIACMSMCSHAFVSLLYLLRCRTSISPRMPHRACDSMHAAPGLGLHWSPRVISSAYFDFTIVTSTPKSISSELYITKIRRTSQKIRRNTRSPRPPLARPTKRTCCSRPRVALQPEGGTIWLFRLCHRHEPP